MSHTVNFLHSAEPEPVHRAHRRKRLVPIILIVLIVLAVVWGGMLLVAAGQVMAAALDGKDALFRARDAAVALQFDQALEELTLADQRLSDAERGMRILLSVQFIPWVGSQVEAADAIVKSSRSVIDALDDVIEIGDELLRLTGLTEDDLQQMAQGLEPSLTFDELSSETKRAVLERLSHSAADLELTGNKIDIAISELNEIERDDMVGPVLAALDPLVAQLSEARRVIDTLAIAARLLPEFAGLGEERAHLLLFLNNTELRPGGGFVGTYGVLRMLDGDIKQLETHDVYALDDPAASRVTRTPPPPLTTYNGATQWFFRDGNWSPDFALSALQLLDMYREESQQTITFQGVIGLTPTFVSDLLEITGPIEVSGQTFTAQNFADKLEYQVEFGYASMDLPPTQRKEIVGDLAEELKARLYALPLSGWVEVIEAVENAFETKQMALYSGDQTTQGVIEAVNWGGRMVSKTPDVQLVVDANLASLKTDSAVQREITYEIFQNIDGTWIGRTTIRYDHRGSFDWKTTRYRTYTRLFVPQGSELIRAEGTLQNDLRLNPSGAPGKVDMFQEIGLTAFGAFTSIEPGQSRDLVFEYTLAPAVADAIEAGRYDLTVLKQVGAWDPALTLDLNFDKKVTGATPPEDASEWGDDAYRLNTELDQDGRIVVEF